MRNINIPTILLIIIILLLLFDRCKPNPIPELDTSSINDKIESILDNNERLREQNLLLTQSNNVYSSIIDSLQTQSINTLRNNLDANMARLKEDRTDTIYIYDVRDTIIDDCLELNKMKDTVINYKDSIITNLEVINHNLEIKVVNFDSISSHQNNIIDLQADYIDDIKKMSKRKNIRSFINGAFIGIGTGLGISLLIK